MKTLLVLRHADPERHLGPGGDHARALTENGRRDAQRLGRRLSQQGEAPDSVLSSSAVRALETFQAANAAGNWRLEPRVSRALYEADPPSALGLVRATDDRIARLLLVGHEPTFSRLVALLANESSVSLAPGTCARIDLYADQWSQVEFGMGSLQWTLHPEQLSDD